MRQGDKEVASSAPHRTSGGDMNRGRKASRKIEVKLSTVVFTAAAVFLVAAGILLWQFAVGQPDRSRYQAVFLDNGQVFFGKLGNVNGTYLTLQEVYYTQNPSADATRQKVANGDVSLIKAGDEVYGPEDAMMIRAEQVLFWQNLKPDSKVSQAISAAR